MPRFRTDYAAVAHAMKEHIASIHKDCDEGRINPAVATVKTQTVRDNAARIARTFKARDPQFDSRSFLEKIEPSKENEPCSPTP